MSQGRDMSFGLFIWIERLSPRPDRASFISEGSGARALGEPWLLSGGRLRGGPFYLRGGCTELSAADACPAWLSPDCGRDPGPLRRLFTVEHGSGWSIYANAVNLADSVTIEDAPRRVTGSELMLLGRRRTFYLGVQYRWGS